MKYNRLLVILLVLAMSISISIPYNTVTVQAKQYTIKDVDSGDEAFESIQDVLNQEWMSLTLGKFYPDKYITRAEFAMILTKLNGQLSEVSAIKKGSFKDVSIKDKYGKYIELQKSYITYYKTKNGKYYKPKNYLTREDALVAIVKALGYDTQEAVANGADSEIDLNEIIEDSNKVSSALETYVTLGVTNELIDLVEDGDATYLYPKKSITRRQLAQLLVNAYEAREYNKIDETTDDSSNDETSADASSDEVTTEETDTDSSDTSSNNIKTNNGTSQSDKAYLNNEYGYIKVDLNGKEMIYQAYSSYDLEEEWCFFYDRYKSGRQFDMELPKSLTVGDSLTNDSAMDADSFPMRICYIDVNDDYYIFGKPKKYQATDHKSSKITITITGNEGAGGYISGTLQGQIVLEDGTIVSFTNGVFKQKLKALAF